MSYFKFNPNDIFVNTIVAYPRFNCVFMNYINEPINYVLINNPLITGTMKSIPEDGIAVLDKNVDRSGNQWIKPFIAKTDSENWISGLTSGTFNSLFPFGTSLTGSYIINKTLALDYITATNNRVASALKNLFNDKRLLNADFSFDNFPLPCSYVLIPRELYGSSIKKGSVQAGVAISSSVDAVNGRVYAIAEDKNKDGILIVTNESLSGSMSTIGQKVGYVLYDEGILLFKSGTVYVPDDDGNLASSTETAWWSSGTSTTYDWQFFGDRTMFSLDNSFSPCFCFLNFQGTQKIQNLTIMCNAPSAKLNNSMNSTFLENNQNISMTQSTNTTFVENKNLTIANIVSSSHQIEEEFSKETYISDIYIYDEDKKLIGIATLANPIRKREQDDFTFKIGYDL